MICLSVDEQTPAHPQGTGDEVRTWPFPPEENSQIASPDAPSTTAMMTNSPVGQPAQLPGGTDETDDFPAFAGGGGVVKNPSENLLKAMETIVLPP